MVQQQFSVFFSLGNNSPGSTILQSLYSLGQEVEILEIYKYKCNICIIYFPHVPSCALPSPRQARVPALPRTHHHHHSVPGVQLVGG